MGKIGAQVLQGIRNLFGKRESNQTPSNLDIIQFNSATQEWELVSAVVGQAVQSASNLGSGEGISKPRIGDDLPFRSLTTTSRISLTGSATEIQIDIGTILISDIQGLQTALDNLEPPFLISDITGLQTALDNLEPPFLIADITGLQTALDSKIETITNVGGEKELIKAKVAQDIPVRTLKAGTNITLVQNADDIEISATGGVIPTKSKFVMGYHADKNWKDTTTYGAMFTNKADEPIEAEAQGFFNFLYEVIGITVFVSNNTDIVGGTITLKRNSVAIPATTITIPALTTGKFSLSVTESFAIADEIHEEHTCSNDNDIKNTSYYLECEALLI